MRLLLATFFMLALAADSGAAWWAENDYTTGSNGLEKESLTLFDNPAPRFSAGLNTSFYSDSAAYKDKVWSFRTPLMYTGEKFFFSLKPFLYPVSPGTRSGAGGGVLSAMTALTDDEQSYLHLTLSGAWAQQCVPTTASADRKTFSEEAGEAQLEKSFFGQFFFLASAAGFSDPAGVSNRTLVRSALDQSDLAYLGTFRQVTALPEWTLSVQAARDMRPDYDSHLYAGYSKISYRGGTLASSGIAGIKINLTERSTLDLAYNFYKEDPSAWKSYYKVFLQVFF